MASDAQFRVQHVAAVPRGYHVRTVTAKRHRVRIAFPPGRRVKGAGQVVEVLHPHGENPCPVKNPAELVLMSANPTGRSRRNPWQIIVRSKISHKGEEVWPATFTTRKAAKEYAYSKFADGSVLRYERIPNPSQTERAGELYEDFHGAAPQHVDEYSEPTPRGITLTELGDLIELRVQRDAGWKWGSLDLAGRGIKLAANPKGTQLYFVGGDQKIRRGALTELGVDNSKQLVDLGALRYVAYRTKKAIVNHINATYEHSMGEDTKEYPRLMYDCSSSEPRLKVSGGAYSVRPEGIVN